MARAVDVSPREKVTTYRYVALTSEGKRVKGTIKATSELLAEHLLLGKGLEPTQLEVAPSMFSLEEALPNLFKVKPRDIIVFSRQLATLLRSGISLLPALQILQGQVTSSRGFRNILRSIIGDIRSGGSFSQAIAKHPMAFNDIYCRTISVGEQSGSLETVLPRIADYQERQSLMGQRVVKALTYPMMVMGLAVVVIVLLMTVVMPQLMGMFTAMNVELPLPTRMLISLTKFFSAYQMYLLVGVSLLAAVVLWLVKQPTGRQVLDRLRLAAPLLGPPVRMLELSRFARTMSLMISAGLNLQEIVRMLPQSTNNRVVRKALEEVRESLFLGEGLSEPMSRLNIFPPLLVQMVAVGEETNTLNFTMEVVADFYEVTADDKMNTLVGMVGPLSTVGIALLVGFVALAVIMPMYTLTGAFGG